jgi:MFS family permease
VTPGARPASDAAAARLPRAVFLLGLTSLLTDASAEMIFPLLPVFLVETLGAGPAFLGLLEGAADAVASVLKLASGWLSDRLGRRKPLVATGYVIAGAARPILAAATAPWHALVVRLTDRVGKGLRSSPRDALIADAAGPAAAGRAFGFHRAMDHAGAVIGPLVATGLLALGLQVRSVFWLAAVPAALAVVAVLLVREPPKPSAAPATAATGAGEATAAPGPGTGAVTLPRSFVSYIAILGVFSLGNSSDIFLLLRARELGVSTALIPILWAALHVVKMASAWLAGDWSDRVPRARLILLGWGIFAAAYLGLGLARAAWHVWALFGLYGLHYGLTEPAEKALVRDLVPPAVRGRAFGWYNFVVGAAALPAGLLTGALWRAWGPRAALGAGAALAGLAAVLLAAWRVNLRGKSP